MLSWKGEENLRRRLRSKGEMQLFIEDISDADYTKFAPPILPKLENVDSDYNQTNSKTIEERQYAMTDFESQPNASQPHTSNNREKKTSHKQNKGRFSPLFMQRTATTSEVTSFHHQMSSKMYWKRPDEQREQGRDFSLLSCATLSLSSIFRSIVQPNF